MAEVPKTCVPDGRTDGRELASRGRKEGDPPSCMNAALQTPLHAELGSGPLECCRAVRVPESPLTRRQRITHKTAGSTYWLGWAAPCFCWALPPGPGLLLVPHVPQDRAPHDLQFRHVPGFREDASVVMPRRTVRCMCQVVLSYPDESTRGWMGGWMDATEVTAGRKPAPGRLRSDLLTCFRNGTERKIGAYACGRHVLL